MPDYTDRDTITTRLNPALRHKLDTAAKKAGLTRSSYLRYIVVTHLGRRTNDDRANYGLDTSQG